MTIVVSVIRGVVRVALLVLQICMFVRAILSWFQTDEDSPLNSFVITVTEPVIAPVRAVIEHFGWFEGLPIDMSFFITFILLSVIQVFL